MKLILVLAFAVFAVSNVLVVNGQVNGHQSPSCDDKFPYPKSHVDSLLKQQAFHDVPIQFKCNYHCKREAMGYWVDGYISDSMQRAFRNACNDDLPVCECDKVLNIDDPCELAFQLTLCLSENDMARAAADFEYFGSLWDV